MRLLLHDHNVLAINMHAGEYSKGPAFFPGCPTIRATDSVVGYVGYSWTVRCLATITKYALELVVGGVTLLFVSVVLYTTCPPAGLNTLEYVT